MLKGIPWTPTATVIPGKVRRLARSGRMLVVAALAALLPVLPALPAQAAGQPTVLTLSPVTGLLYHDSLADQIRATLSDPFGNLIPGASVTISTTHYKCTRKTDTTGTALCLFGPPEPLKPGSYTMSASFPGGHVAGVTWAPASTSEPFTVDPGDAYVSFLGPMTITTGTRPTFRFKLQEGEAGDLHAPIKGARLQVSFLDSQQNPVATCTTRPTTRGGLGSCAMNVNVSPQPAFVQVQWDGSPLYDSAVDQAYGVTVV